MGSLKDPATPIRTGPRSPWQPKSNAARMMGAKQGAISLSDRDDAKAGSKA
jgi:hypothetical protein